MTEAIQSTSNGVSVEVHVVPNASTTQIVGLHGDRVKVRLACPPERNRANDELVRLLAEACGIRVVAVVAGRTTRYKRVELVGADIDQVRRILS